jgi:hypothetical protein
LRFLSDEQTLAALNLRKYYQPPSIAPRFYLPPSLDWVKAAQDTGIKITFVEGEKKAARLAKAGIFAIGLGGVDSFVTRIDIDGKSFNLVEDAAIGKRGRPKKPLSLPLKDFNRFRWEGREVEIDYDNETNLNIDGAARRLSDLLIKLKAIPSRIIRRCECNCKGADDYLENHTIEEYQACERQRSDETIVFEGNYIYLHTPTAVYDVAYRQLLSMKDFHTLTARYKTQVFNINTGKIEEKAAADKWLDKTVVHSRLMYEPSQKPDSFIVDSEVEIEEGKEPVTGYNIWRGFICKPAKPAKQKIDKYLKPWLIHVERCIPDEAMRKHFQQWWAFQFQHPGIRILHAIVLVGRQQGSGKTTLARVPAMLFGGHMLPINNPRMLHARFNTYMLGKSILLGEEIVKKAVDAEQLKGFITEPELWIEPKGIDSFAVINRMNSIHTTNHIDALVIEETARRFLILEVPGWDNDAERREYFNKLMSFLYEDPYAKPEKLKLKDEVAAALLWYYRFRVKLRDFNPYADAPKTEARANMAYHTSDSRLTEFAHNLCIRPKELLGKYYRQAMTLEQIDDAIRNLRQERLPQMQVSGLTGKELQALSVMLAHERIPKVQPYKKINGEDVYGSRVWILDAAFTSKTRAEMFDWQTEQMEKDNGTMVFSKKQQEQPEPRELPGQKREPSTSRAANTATRRAALKVVERRRGAK